VVIRGGEHVRHPHGSNQWGVAHPFQELSQGADAIIMKHILHDWDDDSAVRILQACHRAMGSREVLIVDPAVPSGNSPQYGNLLDLES
jgi:hypothetical protein